LITARNTSATPAGAATNAAVNLKADQQLVDDVDAVAERLGTSRSAIARALIRHALCALEQEA
jgi:metal-responsive CopG/Arc/MetJ family transcriptional regulator